MRRPFESMRWDAKIVLMSVDLPSPVCPIHKIRIYQENVTKTRVATRALAYDKDAGPPTIQSSSMHWMKLSCPATLEL